MRVSYNWLREYVDVPWGVEELAARLTMAGLKVENIERTGGELTGLVAGRIESITPHPAADRLNVCTVDAGGRVLSIVTGAPGLSTGQVVAVAVPGAALPRGWKIETAGFKGVESQGMLLSATEILLGEEHLEDEGILTLEGVRPGADLTEVLELRDYVLELDLTPNYSPALSMLGVAREVAALTGGKVKAPPQGCGGPRDARTSARSIRVRIDDPDLCGRFTAKVIWNVRVGHSPIWMQRRLIAAGLRPINNIVDVTNYVMMETGQPLHAFDYETLRDATIIVRRAKSGEIVTTLDGSERALNERMLVIADAGGAVSVAGVMGGLTTEVTATTRTVLLEAAYFQPLSIRRTAMALAMRSEASLRFEKGIDPNGQADASERAARLMADIGAGEPSADIVDAHPVRVEPKTILVRPGLARTVVSKTLSDDDIAGLLGRYGFDVAPGEGGMLSVTVPTRRVDISEEVDLIEEVARLYGYEEIEPTLLKGATAGGEQPPLRAFSSFVRETMLQSGLTEVSTLSLIDPGSFDRMRLPPECPLRRAVGLMNPLVEEQSIMRTTMAPGLLDALACNASHRVTDVQVFEIGRVIIPRSLPVSELPEERVRLGIAVTGRAGAAHWRSRPAEADFFFVKGVVEGLLRKAGVNGVTFDAVESDTAGGAGDGDSGVVCELLPALHPHRRAVVRAGGRAIGVIGEAHPAVVSEYGLPGRATLAELDLDLIMSLGAMEKEFRQLPRFPAVVRDISVIAPECTPAASIMEGIRDAAGDLLVELRLFDLYTGGQVPEGHRSLAFSLTYRAGDRTLTDAEVDDVHSKVRESLARRGLGLR
ncbi:MAG: phenylalanine--tRNA ligase subunit beta [Ignavibacteriales bacterium]